MKICKRRKTRCKVKKTKSGTFFTFFLCKMIDSTEFQITKEWIDEVPVQIQEITKAQKCLNNFNRMKS